jgi:hypothetical protein
MEGGEMTFWAKVAIQGKVSEDQIEALQRHCTEGETLSRHPEDAEYEWMRGTVMGYLHTLDLDGVRKEKVLRGVKLEVQFDDEAAGVLASIHDRLRRMEEKLLGYSCTVDNEEPSEVRGQQYNSKVEVHVPGLGLLAIDEVRVETDCCTDRLQDCLADGWHILAACPQPDQRRPDYVLGRTKEAK